MTFKREGDDESWLRSLQKRRVSELLAEDIPEGEAYLIKNGKFACMVCSHRPVFDTVNMLCVHRNGRKHLANAEFKKKEEEELCQLREIYMDMHQGASSGKNMKMRTVSHKPNSSSLLGSKPYDPRVKRRPDHRRQVLDLTPKESPCTSADSELSLCQQDFSHYTPAQTISEYKKQRRFIGQQKDIEVKPYQRRTGPPVSGSDRPVSQAKTTNNDNHIQDIVAQQVMNSRLRRERARSQTSVGATAEQETAKQTNANTSPSMACSEMDKEKAALRAKYLQAFASGWKKDRSGCWVKDDNAEFDSDEEPPDLP